MNNPFKNNSLASGLLGFILGIFTLLGGQSIISSTDNEERVMPSSFFQVPDSKTSVPNLNRALPFHGLTDNPNGDVVITKSGDCYHSPYGCSSLSRSKRFRTVDREDADNAGMTACSKCNP